MVGMFKKKQQDKELLDGKIFSGELSEIGVKSQEEQNNVMKGFVKEKYYVAVRELSLIFAECENFFKDELDKLKMIQTSLYECRNRLNKISDKFEQNFIEYLDDMEYCDNE